MSNRNFSDIDKFVEHVRERIVIARGQDFSVLRTYFYETAGTKPGAIEVFTYTDSLSYDPGDEVRFHSHTTAKTFRIQVIRAGANKTIVHDAEIPGVESETPVRASVLGCNWKIAHRWRVPQDLSPGAYLVVSSAKRHNGTTLKQHHILFVRPSRLKPEQRKKRVLLVACTASWTSYNHWGGSSNYVGIEGATGDEFAPELSTQRPFEKGMIWLPIGVPRVGVRESPGPGAVPQTLYPAKTWALSWGYGRSFASSGWATYENHFLEWAEAQGFTVDVISQTDLHFRPQLLQGYSCVVTVGHDEYWSWEMRDHIEAYVRAGGHVARFGGNFIWQIRLEDEGRRQICYKFWASERDPVANDPKRRHLLTSAWEDPLVNRPGATTLGLNGFRGCFSGWGAMMPRASGGYTVYRPAHWAFADTTLHYGDVFGSEAKICSYEVDGVEFEVRKGFPVALGTDGAPTDLEIIAMSPATVREQDFNLEGAEIYIADTDVGFKAILMHGEATPETIADVENGAAMVAVMKSGKGEVFNAGTVEWVAGLLRKDPFTEIISRNVLNRYLA